MERTIRSWLSAVSFFLTLVVAESAFAQRATPPPDCIVAQDGQFLAAGSIQHNVVLRLNGSHPRGCDAARHIVDILPNGESGASPLSPYRLRSNEPRNPELLVYLYKPTANQNVYMMRTANIPSSLIETRTWQLVRADGHTLTTLDIPVQSVGAIASIETRFRSEAFSRYNATSTRENDLWPVAAAETHESNATAPTVGTVVRFAYPFYQGTESLEGSHWCFRQDDDSYQILSDQWHVRDGWTSLDRREVLLSIPEGVAAIRGTIYRLSNASCDVDHGGLKTVQRVEIPVRARRQSFRVPIARSMGVSDLGTRLFLACDNLTTLSPSVCDGTLDEERLTQSNGVVAPSRQRTCELRLYDRCTPGGLPALDSFGPQRFHVMVKSGGGTMLREFFWVVGRGAGSSLQINLGLADISDDNDSLIVTAKEESGGDITYNTLDPDDAPQFNFTARIISRGTFGFSAPLRTFLTVQTSPLSVRLPAAVRDLERSSDSTAIQLLPTRVGLFAALEPWDYVNRRHPWPIPLRLIAGGYFLAINKQVFWPSLAVGISIRQPILESNSSIASSVSINLLYELDLRGGSPSSALLLTASLDLFSFFSPKTASSNLP